MNIKDADVAIPEKLVPYLCTIKDGKTVGDKAVLSVIIGLFASKIVTLEKAAELAEKSVWDFIDILQRYQIPWGEYTEEEFEMDNMVLDKIKGGFYE